MKCPKCGNILPYGAQFCNKCGEKITIPQNNYNNNGYNYNSNNYNQQYQPNPNKNHNYDIKSAPYEQMPPKSNAGLIIAVCLIAVLLIVGTIGIGIAAISSMQDEIEEERREVIDIIDDDYIEIDDDDDYKKDRVEKTTETLKTEKPLPTQKTEAVTAPPSTPKPGAAKKQFFTVEAGSIELFESSLDYESMPQQQLNLKSGEVFDKWDKLLNEVYQYLKQTMPANEFKKLEQDEIAWIKEKEAAMEKERAAWQGGSGASYAVNSVATRYTKDRCYYLISLIG